MNYDSKPFTGVKAALLDGDRLLVYQRDNKPGLRFAGLWDFFGGGREGNETPYECLVRELNEELKITVAQDQVIFNEIFPAMHDPSQDAYFMVVFLAEKNILEMKFGSEGQACKFVSIDEFLQSGDFVPDLRPRLQSYLMVV